MLRVVLLLLSAVAALCCPSAEALATPSSKADNVKRCLVGDPYCDMRKLSATQRRRVFERAQRRHLDSCLAGLMCNMAVLTQDEQARVRAAVAHINYQACREGRAGCRPEDLSEAQRREAARLEQERNLDRCLNGLSGCDESLLSASQIDDARERARERNYALCLQGAFVECRIEDLSAERRARVEQRRREANLFLCTYSLVGCREDLLTAQERERVAQTRPTLMR
jgi:hypothetical protein